MNATLTLREWLANHSYDYLYIVLGGKGPNQQVTFKYYKDIELPKDFQDATVEWANLVYDYCSTIFKIKLKLTVPEEKQVELNTSIHANICKELTDLYSKKNSDYGDSFHKSFEEFGMTMVCIRLADKYNRLASLCGGKDRKVMDESIDDTLMDLANYAIMALIERRKNE